MTNGKTILGLMVVGLMICALSVTAYGDSVPWEREYNANELPDAATPVWTHCIGNPSLPGTNTVSGGILTLSTMTNGGNADYWKIDGSVGGVWNMASGAGNQHNTTVEFRVRMLEHRVGQTNIMDFYFYDGVKRTSFSFQDNAVIDSDQPSRWTSSAINTYEWHTYRLTIDYDAIPGRSLKTLYADGNETPILQFDSYYEYNTTSAYIAFGDLAGVTAGKMELDYIRWTNSGVYPAPEPATMALLGLGGLGILIRRKR